MVTYAFRLSRRETYGHPQVLHPHAQTAHTQCGPQLGQLLWMNWSGFHLQYMWALLLYHSNKRSYQFNKLDEKTAGFFYITQWFKILKKVNFAQFYFRLDNKMYRGCLKLCPYKIKMSENTDCFSIWKTCHALHLGEIIIQVEHFDGLKISQCSKFT